MPRTLRARAAWLMAGLALLGCASRVQVPPRVDLGDWPTIGILEFTAGSEAELANRATRRFVQMVQTAQPGTPILELGSELRVLSEVGHRELDFAAVREIGERYRVDALFTGRLELGPVKPSVRVGQTFTSLKARADVTLGLATKLLETRSGATVWSRSSQATANVAHLGLQQGSLPSLGATEPSQLYDGLLGRVVADLGRDFRPSWQKQ